MNTQHPGLSRRDFLRTAAAGGAAAAVGGCATNPVTGERQFMTVTQGQEIALDREASPKQFSADYGPSQDAALNAYVGGVGRSLSSISHRPDMPFSFRVVNAVYANAYAFPGGSIAVTRGMLVELTDEAQLAGLLGHEIAHVSYRHTAQQMSQGMLIDLALAGASYYVASERPGYEDVVAGLGGLGGTMLLARYSREHERQADATGMDYMYRAGYDPQGMVDLMDVLVRMSEGDRAGMVETLFATHPMSTERRNTAAYRVAVMVPPNQTLKRNADVFLAQTAALQKQKPAIMNFQKGEEALGAKKLDQARTLISDGLRALPDDYAGLLLLAQVAQAQHRPQEAASLAQRAASVYPGEAQAQALLGRARFAGRDYDGALAALQQYNRALPGDPMVPFYAGLCHERSGRRNEAAMAYRQFLSVAGNSPNAAGSTPVRHAYARLQSWSGGRP